MAKAERERSPVPGLFLIGQLSETAMPLLRSVVLARLLPVEAFGVALALTALASIVEQSSDLGFNRFAVKIGRTGKGPSDIDTIHSLSVMRGVIIGLALVACGPLIANMFNTPDAWLAFSLVGLSSMIRGFENLGVKQLMRDYVFWPEGLTVAAYQVSWSIAVVAYGFISGDYWAMVIGILAGQAGYALMSHLLSRNRWRLGWNRKLVREALKFGAPLVPNGISLAAKSLGDRLVIGALLGVAPMAIYSTTVIAALLPRGVIVRLMSSLALPYFVNFGKERARTDKLFDGFTLSVYLVAVFYGIAFICFGPPLIALLFGVRYQPSQVFAGLVAANAAVKFLFLLPQPAAIAFNRVGLVLYGSVGALVGLAGASGALVLGFGLNEFVGVTVAIEWLSLMIILWLYKKAFDVHATTMWIAGLTPPALLLAATVGFEVYGPVTLFDRIVAAFGLSAVALAIAGLMVWNCGIKLRHIKMIVGHRPDQMEDAT